MRRLFGSVRVRITLAATLVFALALGIGAFVLVRGVRASLEDRLRSDGEKAAVAFKKRIEAGQPPEDVIASAPVAGFGVQAVVGQGGGVLAGSPGMPEGSLPMQVVGPLPAPGSTVTRGNQLVVSKQAASPAGPVTLVASSPLDSIRRSVDSLVDVLRFVIPALVALVGVLIWFLVGRSLRPVAAIRSEVDEITHGTLHRRVPVPDSHDEIARLAGTMNQMLERLESSSARQRAFVSDASHELRSPVTSIRATLEVALRNRERIDWPDVAQQVLHEDERMDRVVTDLLDLARVDENSDSLARAPFVDLEDVVLEEVPRVRRHPVRTERVSAGRVRGRREQLARVVRNLLDNADRHAGDHVEVALSNNNGTVDLVVEDDGPGIPEADRERVFDRFTRLDEGRARDTGGAGIGLAMVRAIVERHGGRVRIEASIHGGARFVVSLPNGYAGAPDATERIQTSSAAIEGRLSR
jgi:signal transduction histidine kinase